jgi:hypothetical protein
MSKQSAQVTYWTVAANRPPFGDALSPTSYRLSFQRGSEMIGYSTLKGYERHVSSIRRYATEDGGRIIEETYMPSGALLIIYRPGY